MSKYSKVMAMLEEKYEGLKALVNLECNNDEWTEREKFGYRAWNAGQLKLVEELLEQVRTI